MQSILSQKCNLLLNRFKTGSNAIQKLNKTNKLDNNKLSSQMKSNNEAPTIDFEADKISDMFLNNINLPDNQLKSSNIYNQIIIYVIKHNLVKSASYRSESETD